MWVTCRLRTWSAAPLSFSSRPTARPGCSRCGNGRRPSAGNACSTKSGPSMNPDPLKELQARLGYSFRNTDLMRHALTHASTGAAVNYERLEFLGDRVIGLVMAEILYNAFPDESEG